MGQSAAAYCVAGADYQKQFQKVIEDCLPQHIFSFCQKGMKFKHKVEAVMTSHKEVYEDTQHKQDHLKITLFVNESLSPLNTRSLSCDDHDNLQPGTPASFQ
jgi:hypothetical protein